MRLSAKIMCLMLWTVCVAQDQPCAFPQIKNGELFREYWIKRYFTTERKERYDYHCNPGFVTPSGEYWDKIHCTAQGWEPAVPCRKVCGIHYIENGEVLQRRGDYIQDQSVRVRCYSGYSLPNDQDTVTCTENGWSPLPKCIRVKTCSGSDIEIENGFLSEYASTYDLNRKTQYRCKQGFVTSNGETSGTITCLQNGWSAQPSCIKSCDRPVFENAVTKDNSTWFKLNDKLDYECHAGYENRHKDTKGSIICNYDGWSDRPSCYDQPCAFPQIKNGELYREHWIKLYFTTERKERYDYHCNEGFVTPSGEYWDRIHCTARGWEPAVPCRKVCGIHYIENGEVLQRRGDYIQDQSVRVRCHSGYSLPNDQDTVTCTENGWSPQPKCIRVKTCSKSDIEIENGFLSEYASTYDLNRETQYRCKQGFVTSNGETSGTITCLQNGWSAQPSCIKSCDRPVFENAVTKDNSTWFKLNDKLDYECHAGYENRHKDTKGSIICNYDGWSDRPSCYERECSIPFLDQYLLVNPKKEKYKIGDLLNFSCQRGHRVGPDSVQCYHFGWSPSFPTCKGQVRSCDQPPELFNGEFNGTKKEQYSHGEVVEYDCKPRFLLKGPNKIQCMDGNWTTLPTCVEEERTCSDIPQLEHGFVQFSVPPYYHGDSVEFTCKETFTMIGHGSVSCISGRWTQLPQCVAKDKLEKCKAPYSIEASPSNKNEFNHTVIIRYKCKGNQEYKQSICINGRWDPEPTCTRVEKEFCPPPPQIPNAQVLETTVKYWDGEKVSVLCQDNYILQNTEEMVCKDGRWQSLPLCIVKIPCSQPPEINHGSIKLPRLSEERRDTAESSSYEHGTTLSYVCDDGFRMAEEHGVTCHMGKWSAPPRCVGENPYSTGKCGPPPPIDNGDITSFPLRIYEPSSSVEYQCQSLYQLQGNKIITCRNGEWSDPPKCLHPCVISEEILKRHNITSRWKRGQKLYSKSGDYVEFSCISGYTKANESPPFRTMCIDGHINYPSCTKKFLV